MELGVSFSLLTPLKFRSKDNYIILNSKFLLIVFFNMLNKIVN